MCSILESLLFLLLLLRNDSGKSSLCLAVKEDKKSARVMMYASILYTEMCAVGYK